jgi:hypothetical protein
MTPNNSDTAAVLHRGAKKLSRRQGAPRRRDRPKSASVELIDEQGNVTLFDHFELSSTGVYLHSDYLLCTGDPVALELTLSGCPHPLEITGEIIRAETGNDGLRPGMRVIFKNMLRDARSELERFLIRRVIADAR